jgi:DNA-binding cell septation regulator SpoVG
MKITIEHIGGQRPQFNVALSSGEGKEPFITIKGCRVVDGAKGAFISWPATKNQASGKYWNHVWASDAFNAAVLAEVIKTSRAQSKPKADGDAPF